MGELKINVGDIKKFKTGNSDKFEISGVVLEKSYNSIVIMDLTGDVKTLQYYIIKDITSVRLEPDVRARLEKIGAIAKEKEKLIKQQEKIRQEKLVLDNKIEKQREYYMNSIGVMNKNLFINELSKSLRSKYDSIMDDYSISVYATVSGIQLSIEKDIDIVKYPRVEDYPFLYREYDGALMIYDDLPSYKQMVERYKNKGRELKITSKEVSGFEKKERRGLYMGDKSLFYNHTISIMTKYNRLDKKLLKEVLKIFG